MIFSLSRVLSLFTSLLHSFNSAPSHCSWPIFTSTSPFYNNNSDPWPKWAYTQICCHILYLCKRNPISFGPILLSQSHLAVFYWEFGTFQSGPNRVTLLSRLLDSKAHINFFKVCSCPLIWIWLSPIVPIPDYLVPQSLNPAQQKFQSWARILHHGLVPIKDT